MTQQHAHPQQSTATGPGVWIARLILLALVGLGLSASWMLGGLGLGARPPAALETSQSTIAGRAEDPAATAGARTEPGPQRGPETAPQAEPKTEPQGEPAAAQAAPAAAQGATRPGGASGAFENAPGVLGVSIRTLRRETIKAYPTESLGLVALGLEDLGLPPVNKAGHIEVNLGERIPFEGSAHAVPKKGRRLLDGIGRLLAENPDTKVLILTHTDDQGDAGFNLRLSQRRADALKDYLIGRGVTPARIATAGRGEEAPLAGTPKRQPSRGERAKNRRTELVVEHLELAESPAEEADGAGAEDREADPAADPGPPAQGPAEPPRTTQSRAAKRP
jgi:outer membrane protein OmpA-like peptidoglycan-associated protein